MGNVLKKYNEEEAKWQVIGGAITGDTLPIGTIIAYGSYNVPTGWLGCNGQAISRTIYAKLFSIIGTYFGEGNGSTTFNVPNLNNYSTPIGYVYGEEQSERGHIGATGGAETHTMTIYELTPHTHNFNRTWGGSSAQDNSEKKVQAGYGDSSYWADGITESAGEGDPFSLMQPYVTTNYIIKAFQSSGVIANIAQAKTESDIDTYSCNYINDLSVGGGGDSLPIGTQVVYNGASIPDGWEEVEDYSTTEIDTGKTWIDGKPIYRKVITGALSGTERQSFPLGINNLGMIISLNGIVSNGSNFFTLPSYRGSDHNTGIQIWADTTYGVSIICENDRAGYTAYIQVEYTKTTS